MSPQSEFSDIFFRRQICVLFQQDVEGYVRLWKENYAPKSLQRLYCKSEKSYVL